MPRKPIDYSKAIIYKICCKNPDESPFVYVGSTTNFINRKYAHKKSCNNVKDKSYHFKVYQTIRENGGWTNWNMLMLEEYPCEGSLHLRKREEEVRLSFTQTSNSSRCFTDGKCSVDGCENKARRNGLCVRHGAKHLRCTVDGCENQRRNNGVCRRHGADIKRLLCTVQDCENQRLKNGLCFKHGGKKLPCTVQDCTSYQQKNKLCYKHRIKN